MNNFAFEHLAALVFTIMATAFCIANYLRGRGEDAPVKIGGRWGCVAIMGIATALCSWLMSYSSKDIAINGLNGVFGMYFFLVWGWGLYFASFTWQWRVGEEEIPWIDWVALKLVPFVTADVHWTNGLRGTIAFSIRALYLVLLFAIFSFSAWKYSWSLLVFALLTGVIYASNRLGGMWKKYGTAVPEAITGLLLGVLAATALVLGSPRRKVNAKDGEKDGPTTTV